MNTTEHTYKDVLLSIPFFGYANALETGYEKATTSCGMCCIAMILQSKNIEVPIADLITKGHVEGGYGPHGWIHDYFIRVLKEYSIAAVRKENMSRQGGTLEIQENILNNRPVIISGRKLFMEQTSFHMVLITGIRIDASNNCVGFYYHDPAAKNEHTGMYHFVPIDTFHQYWRQMAIVLE